MRNLQALLKGSLTFGGGSGYDVGPFWSRPDVGWSSWGDREEIGASFAGYVDGAYKRSGVVFACILARQMVFSEARFQFQRMTNGRPGDLFGTPELGILETPWRNGTTGDLLSRMEQDVSLAGNFFATPRGDGPDRRLRRLRPDCVTIITGSPSDDPFDLDAEVAGYLYTPPTGGRSGPVLLAAASVAHYAPIPDPDAQWRGMSWLTPVIRDTEADIAATKHKLKFFEHGATANFVVTYDKQLPPGSFDAFVAKFKEAHAGVDNAYKTIHLGGGADVQTIGSNLQQLDFKVTQGAGEPLALDTPVPTPTGWSTMGDLAVGDEVIGSDGLPAQVVGVSPVHEGRECYRVTFNDRTSVVADGSHLWTVSDRNTTPRDGHLLTTDQARQLMAEWKVGGNRFGIAPAAAAKFAAADLLVDPYVLGAWLGDGDTAGAAVCGAPDDLREIAAEVESRGYTVTRRKTSADRVDVIGLPGGLLAALRALGVLGHKHIPADYLRASMDQRLDLLRGLMDTDGSVGHVGKETCEFSSKYEHLARQVAELVRSLGNRATVSVKREPRSRTSETWRVTFRADPDQVPFLLARKVDRCRTPLHVRNRAIVSVEPVASVPVRCIAVDTADHLFCVGEGWVLTHNTRIAAASGVGAVIANLSEGLAGSSLNAGNYTAAKRRFADGTIRPLWRSAAASLAPLLAVPGGSRLWYDASGVPFLSEDATDAANIQQVHASTITALIRDGFTPDSATAAVMAGDLRLLAHTGLTSVQLQQPGADLPTP